MDDLLDLAKDLIDSTRSNGLKWKEESHFGLPPSFSATVGDYTISVRHSFNTDSEVSAYVIALIDESGNFVGTASRTEHDEDYQILDRLYEVAVASARNLGEAVKKVRSLLVTKKSSGERASW